MNNLLTHSMLESERIKSDHLECLSFKTEEQVIESAELVVKGSECVCGMSAWQSCLQGASRRLESLIFRRQ